MSDEKNRDAARRASREERDLFLQVRAYTARLRSGACSPAQAQLEALLGDEVACQAIGAAPGRGKATTIREVVDGLTTLGLWNADLRTLCSWYLARYAWQIIMTINRSGYYAQEMREDARDFDSNIEQWLDGADPIRFGIEYWVPPEAEEVFLGGLEISSDEEASKARWLLEGIRQTVTFAERRAQEGQIPWVRVTPPRNRNCGPTYTVPRNRLLISSARWNRMMVCFQKAKTPEFLLVYALGVLRQVLVV
jgi:hypothetical protein